MRIAYVKAWQTADIAVANKTWGANRNFVRSWQVGEPFVILVDKEGVVVAAVAGPSYDASTMIWPNDVYEHRVPLTIELVVKGADGHLLNTKIRDALKAGYGSGYGWVLLTQSKLPDAVEKSVAAVL